MNAGIVLKLGASVAHMSGDINRFGRTLILQDADASQTFFPILFAVSGFFLGAVLAGFTIHHPTLNRALPYGRCLVFIGICLLSAHLFLDSLFHVALLLCGFASGFQNAIATHYRGIILRTTHVTGLMTDVGSHLGMLLRGHSIAPWKIFVPAIVIFFYFLGSVFGTWIFLVLHAPFLLWIGSIYVLGGSSWFVIQRLTPRTS